MSRMNDEDDVAYNSNNHAINGQKFPSENVRYPRDIGDSDGEDDDDGEDEKAEDNGEDEDEEDDDGGSGVQRIGKDDYDNNNNDNDDNGDQQRHPKKRKLKNLISSYEFAPRIPAPPPAPPSVPKPYGGRNPLTDWTEHESLVLLDSWGDRFLKHGRKSLRSEEWQEVAEKVSQESRIERTDTQCRNRLDTLKKKYKKEKMKLGDGHSEWVYFKKIDTLLSAQMQETGLSCRVDSGEYEFMHPKVDQNRKNGSDEMMDSPGNLTEGEGDESDGLPPKKAKKEQRKGGGASFKMVADCFRRFSEIYERIESSKRVQMVELEKMRMEFHRDLELQKREILERAQADIAKIRTGDEEAENFSG